MQKTFTYHYKHTQTYKTYKHSNTIKHKTHLAIETNIAFHNAFHGVVHGAISKLSINRTADLTCIIYAWAQAHGPMGPSPSPWAFGPMAPWAPGAQSRLSEIQKNHLCI